MCRLQRPTQRCRSRWISARSCRRIVSIQVLAASLWNDAGLGGLAVVTQGAITVDAPVTLADGGIASLLAPSVAVSAPLTAHGWQPRWAITARPSSKRIAVISATPIEQFAAAAGSMPGGGKAADAFTIRLPPVSTTTMSSTRPAMLSRQPGRKRASSRTMSVAEISYGQACASGPGALTRRLDLLAH
jgi:hypothetical protein